MVEEGRSLCTIGATSARGAMGRKTLIGGIAAFLASTWGIYEHGEKLVTQPWVWPAFEKVRYSCCRQPLPDFSEEGFHVLVANLSDDPLHHLRELLVLSL